MAAVIGVGLLFGFADVAATAGEAFARPCLGARKIRLSWSNRGTGTLFVSATQCPPPRSCSASRRTPDGVPVTSAPVTVTLTDGTGRRVSGVLDADTIVNRGGCPGGTDSHDSGLTYIFGEERGQTTVVVRRVALRLRNRAAWVPVEPLSVSVRDANGYGLEVSASRCDVRATSTGVRMSCADSAR